MSGGIKTVRHGAQMSDITDPRASLAAEPVDGEQVGLATQDSLGPLKGIMTGAVMGAGLWSVLGALTFWIVG